MKRPFASETFSLPDSLCLQRGECHDISLLQSLLDSVPTPIVFKDDQGRYLGGNGKKPSLMEHRLTGADGATKWLEISTSPIKGPGGVLEYLVNVCRDITARKDADRQIERLACFDSLTGLPNRTLVVDRLNQAINPALRDGAACWRWFCSTSIISRRSTILWGTSWATRFRGPSPSVFAPAYGKATPWVAWAGTNSWWCSHRSKASAISSRSSPTCARPSRIPSRSTIRNCSSRPVSASPCFPTTARTQTTCCGTLSHRPHQDRPGIRPGDSGQAGEYRDRQGAQPRSGHHRRRGRDAGAARSALIPRLPGNPGLLFLVPS